MKNGLRKFLLSVWLWAVVPTILISFVVPEIGERYRVSIEHNSFGEEMQLAFSDLNGDGITERIQGQPGPPLNGFPVMDNEQNFYDQWNLPDQLQPGISDLSFGDFDDDRYGEIYVFTLKGDSVFLNVNEFFDSAGLLLERVFIDRINPVEGQSTSATKPIGFFDTNGDGKKEFYFGITAGFGLWPRLCYYYDLENRKLVPQEKNGINFNLPNFRDLDGDNRPEIFSNMTASGNHNIPTPFTDYSAWVMVLDDKLSFKFPPVEFPGFGGSLNVKSVQLTEKTAMLAVVYNFRGAERQIKEPGIYLFDTRGMQLRSASFEALKLNGNVLLETTNHDAHPILLITNELVALDQRLQVIRRVKNPIESPNSYFLIDIDRDSIDEIFINDYTSQKTAVVNNELQLLATIPLALSGDNLRPMTVRSGKGENEVFLRSGANGYFLGFKKNPYYMFWFLIYPGVYLAFALFIIVIRKVNTRQVEKRESQKRRLLTLQLQSVKSQLDPHFTFNALNSVASLLYLDDRKLAYDALNKFTRLLRQMLNDADKVYRTLEEELQFVNGYLELEKLRFGNMFSYEISIGEGVTKKELVPKMVLQTFAENAVKHGLVPLSESGALSIHVIRNLEELVVIIEDNGVGRAVAAQNNKSFGIGLKMMGELYDTLAQLTNKTVKHKIIDQFSADGRPSGTRVEISLAIDLQPIPK